MSDPTPILSIVEGVPVVSSLKVADHFGKQHKHVLEAVQRIVQDTPEDFTEPNFRPSEYLDQTGRKLPAYNLTRDGFTLLCMGFTGKKALAWKLRYIEAFNAMEKQLMEQSCQALPAPAPTPLVQVLTLIRQAAPKARERRRLLNRIEYRFGSQDLTNMTPERLDQVLAFVQGCLVAAEHDDSLLEVQDVVQRLGCSRSHVYALIAAGTLQCVRLGREKGLRVPEQALQAFLLAREEQGALPASEQPDAERAGRLEELLRDCRSMAENLLATRKKMDRLLERLHATQTGEAISLAQGFEDVFYGAAYVHTQCRHLCLDLLNEVRGLASRAEQAAASVVTGRVQA